MLLSLLSVSFSKESDVRKWGILALDALDSTKLLEHISQIKLRDLVSKVLDHKVAVRIDVDWVDLGEGLLNLGIIHHFLNRPRPDRVVLDGKL